MSTWPSLSRFEIRRLLGKGGSGKVYLALDRKLNHEVALKLIPFSSSPNSMLQLERAGASYQQKLAEICQQVPKVFDFGDENGFFWVSMEHVDGISLSDELRNGPFPVARAIHIAAQLCELLMKMHEFPDEVEGQRKLGVVHGDIKPGNILLQNNSRVRVIDFGISKQLPISKTTTELKFGSLPYTPPERLQRKMANRASDLWAVGVVLYEMLSGTSPFRGNTKEEVEQEILAGNIRPLPPGKPDDLRWIINTCLFPNADKRFSSAADLREELLLLQDRLSIHNTTELHKPEPGAAEEPTPLLPAPQAPQENHAPSPRRDPHATTRVRRKTDSLADAAPEARPRPLVREVAQPRPQSSASRKIRAVYWLPAMSLILFTGIQLFVWQRAGGLQQTILRGDSSVSTAESWLLYNKVKGLDLFGLAEWRLSSSAAEILSLYTEQGRPLSREQWKTAFRLSGAALDIDKKDRMNQARLAYCAGQIKRSDLSDKNPLQESFGEREKEALRETISNFQSSADLAPEWMDPHIALASVHAYLSLNPAEMERSIEKAEQLGYRDVRRLTEYRADGYKRYGWKLAQQARFEAGSQKRQHLDEGIQYLKTSIDLYLKLPGDERINRARNEAEKWLGYARNRLNDT